MHRHRQTHTETHTDTHRHIHRHTQSQAHTIRLHVVYPGILTDLPIWKGYARMRLELTLRVKTKRSNSFLRLTNLVQMGLCAVQITTIKGWMDTDQLKETKQIPQHTGTYLTAGYNLPSSKHRTHQHYAAIT